MRLFLVKVYNHVPCYFRFNSDFFLNRNPINTQLNLSGNSIVIDFSQAGSGRFLSGSFVGYFFSDADGTLPPITNVNIDSLATTLGISSSDITFTENTIAINVEGLTFNPNTTAKFDVEFGQQSSTPQIKLEVFLPERNTFGSNSMIATIGDGVEFTQIPDNQYTRRLVDVNIDVDVNFDTLNGSILFDFSNTARGQFDSAAFNGYVFTELSDLPGIKNVKINKFITNLGISESNITFTENTIDLNVQGLSFDRNNKIQLYFNLEGSSPLNSPFYRFANKSVPGTYLFASDLESKGIADNFSEIFNLEGESFKVSSEAEDGLLKYNRFQSKINPGTYLFASEEESVSIRQNFSSAFQEEGVAFYALGANANQGQDVIRFQSLLNPGNYLFALEEEARSIRQNFSNIFREEGVAFEVNI